jgi:uncharacterized protein YkwD
MNGKGRIAERNGVLRLFWFSALVCLFSGAVASLAYCSELPLVSGNRAELNTLQGGNPSVSRQRTVFINPDMFLKGRSVDSLRLNLFEDVQLLAARNKTQSGSRGSVLWTGILVGAETGTVVLITRDRQVSATVFLPEVTYQVRPLGNDLHLIREVNGSAVHGLERIPPAMPSHELKMIELVNRERAAEGLPSLQYSDMLSTVSRNHAADMALSNYYSHERRDGRKFYQRIFDTGYPISKCGENIAVGLTTPEEVFEGWINSPEHRANILNSDFTEIGVGNAVGNNKVYWAQEFGSARRPGSQVLKLAAGPSPLQLFRSMGRIFQNL